MTNVVVVGGGHAGLAVSWHLRRRGIEHLVLEQGGVGESWRTQRWDSFALNTPAWASTLPGEAEPPGPRDAFLSRDEWVAHLEGYARRHQLPVRTGRRVTALDAEASGSGFRLDVTDVDDATGILEARAVVLACGFQRIPRMPPMAGALADGVASMHTADYRGPDQLAPGAVLVVGSGQSGGQVAEDLLDAERTVYVAASSVNRIPRRYRGRDIFEWLFTSAFAEQRPEDLADPRVRFAAQPLVSGVGRYGHTLSLQLLATRGATLLGHLRDMRDGCARLDQDLAASVRFGDRTSVETRQSIDQGIAVSGREAPPPELDPADEPVPDPEMMTSPDELDLVASGVTTVIWATGFGGDLSWVRLPIADGAGTPVHDGGRAWVPGVWFAGIPWQRKRKSGIILGADEDAGLVADEVAAFLAG